MKAGFDVAFGQVTGLFQALAEIVAFGIHIGGGHVSDLACSTRESYTLVVHRRSEPDRPAIFIHLLRFPKPDVMPVPRIGADLLLERQVLFASKQEETTNRCALV